MRLLKAGWSSLSIERYAAFRWGEDIPASTLRSYKRRHRIKAVPSTWGDAEQDDAIDVVGKRAELIRLQEQRVNIDFKHEEAMGKLFGSNAREIELLSKLLSDHKADLQDLGVLPRAGETVTIAREGPSFVEAPRARSLQELLGDAVEERELALVLHRAAGRVVEGTVEVGDGV